MRVSRARAHGWAYLILMEEAIPWFSPFYFSQVVFTGFIAVQPATIEALS
jgi:hypothetical protein